MDDLVEQMLDADSECGTRGDSWRTYCEEDRKAFRKGMTAAAKKLLDAALGDVTPEERKQFAQLSGFFPPSAETFMQARKNRLLAPKTIEERIEDYITKWQITSPLVSRHQIAVEMLGLIAEMKEKA